MQSRTGTFQTADGRRLFERHWLSEGEPRAHLVIVHGYAEHSGRYEHVGAYLTWRGYAVHALDLRGHGQSEGDRVLVRSFDEFLDDVDAFLARVREQSGARPLFLLGHSMGGTVVALAAATRRPDVRGVLLSGAVLSAGGGLWQSLMLRAMSLLGRVWPRLRLRKLAAETVSRDPAVVAKYDSDPLNYRGKIPAGTAGAMIRAMRGIEHGLARIADPLLIMHGTADVLADPAGSRRLFERAASDDKTLKLYDALFHEILNEPEQRQVMDDIAAWMEGRCGDGKQQTANSKSMESREQEAESREQEAESRDQRAGSREQRAGSREQTAGSRQQEAESREQEAESREQRAESREQEAESRKQRAEGGSHSNAYRRDVCCHES